MKNACRYTSFVRQWLRRLVNKLIQWKFTELRACHVIRMQDKIRILNNYPSKM